VRNRLRAPKVVRRWSHADLADLADLANRLDVSRQTVDAVQTGRYEPGLPLALRNRRGSAEPVTGGEQRSS
jgi:putative transcriptional regulator